MNIAFGYDDMKNNHEDNKEKDESVQDIEKVFKEAKTIVENEGKFSFNLPLAFNIFQVCRKLRFIFPEQLNKKQ